jgi:hypothetical protein
MKTHESNGHWQKARAPIRESWDLSANVTEESKGHSQKAAVERVLADDGRQIEEREDRQKALSSTEESWESGSNATDERC